MTNQHCFKTRIVLHPPSVNPHEHLSSSQRRCESKRIGRAQSEATLARHGHQWATSGYETRCDYDGSFYRTQCTSTPNACSCVDKNNVQIAAYGVNENIDYWEPWMGCK